MSSERETDDQVRRWSLVVQNENRKYNGPSQRSLHAGCVCWHKLYIFGGYDGNNRVNDLHYFDFNTKMWHLVKQKGAIPSPRDRHCVALLNDSLYLFGGFDGNSRRNDFYKLDLESHTWTCLPSKPSLHDTAVDTASYRYFSSNDTDAQSHRMKSRESPSPRHSAALLGHEESSSLFLFGGFDGEYKNDTWVYNVELSSWKRVMAQGKVPRARYRMSYCLFQDKVYVFGGHDGTRHLNDLYGFSLANYEWTEIEQKGTKPIARDSHSGVIYGNAMYLFGGSSGSALNDFHEFNLITHKWSAVQIQGMVPTTRFCHVGVIFDHSFYIFGGYDGTRRLNDFQSFWFGYGSRQKKIPPSRIIDDLVKLMDNPTKSALPDVTFRVQGKDIQAHRLMCRRCPYFKHLIDEEIKAYGNPGILEDKTSSGSGSEWTHDDDVKQFGSKTSRSPFVIENVKYDVFMCIMLYLYSDRDRSSICPSVTDTVKLYELAIVYKISRLRSICLSTLAGSISVDNVSWMLRVAHNRNLPDLRKICLYFVKENFDSVSTSKGFEEVGRENVEIVFEILRERSQSDPVDKTKRNRTDSLRNSKFEQVTSDISELHVCSLPRWKRVLREDIYADGKPISFRSLHASALYKNYFYVFGGYDGRTRVKSFDRFDLKKKEWTVLKNYTPPNALPNNHQEMNAEGSNDGRQPSPRDRHTLVTVGDCLYLFGGFYNSSRTNELYCFDLSTNRWSFIPATMSTPTPRHGHSATSLGNSMWVFGGYDGAYMNDLYEFNCELKEWERIAVTGQVPQERYRSSIVASGSYLYVYGGHDGIRHLSDVCLFNIDLKTWHLVRTSGKPPLPRDSHSAVVSGQIMYVFGGSSGAALNDFVALDLQTHTWSTVQTEGLLPASRFCHVAEVYNSCLYIFGGYNGVRRLNDFSYVELSNGIRVDEVPSSRIIQDLGMLVNKPYLSDIQFIVEDEVIYAHKVLCGRAPYFFSMFITSNMIESRMEQVELREVQKDAFLDLLRYLYTDEFSGNAVEVFELADRFGVDRLKAICESEMFTLINCENVASVLYTANRHSSLELRDASLKFLLDNFDTVSKTEDFENVARADIDLVIEVLHLR